MKVAISCVNKFHSFHLAEQLDKHGYLIRLLTPYYSSKNRYLPEFRDDKEVIAPDKVVTNIIPEFIKRAGNTIPFIRSNFNLEYFALELFDSWAKNNFGSPDLLVAWAGGALQTIRIAKARGVVTVLERGSTHILFQEKILREEYDKYGISFAPIDPKVIKKELAEYSEVDYISIPSKFAKQTYIDLDINPDKLIQVPYGVDLNLFTPTLKEDNIFRIVFVGGLTLRKGVQYLLQAFSELKLKNAELLLIGAINPELKAVLVKYQDCYKYIGVVPHINLYKHLSQSSVFILPSIEEGLAMVIPQAMACGLPVICTSNSGGDEIIANGQEGFIIPIRTVEAIKEKILYLYEHPEERETMGKSARKTVEKEFSWDNYGERIIECYSRIIRK